MAITIATLFPTLLTWLYFVALAGHASGGQQAAFAAGKLLQFGFPAVWCAWVLHERLGWQGPRRAGVVMGTLFGLAVAATMLVGYHLLLKPSGFFVGPGEAIRGKVVELGIRGPWAYAGLGVFYSLCHSLLEEYYWRWFVFRQLRRHVSLGPAIAISSLGFMAHHVILLATYFGWHAPATYVFSAGVAVGGAVWAWIYERTRSLYGPWISHLLVDAAIFLLGYDLVRSLW